jgi:hypothetical protein
LVWLCTLVTLCGTFLNDSDLLQVISAQKLRR